MNKIRSFICGDCKKTFSNHSNLVAHVRKFHPDKLEIIKPKKIYRYKCDTCGKNFSHIHNLKYHQSKAKHSARLPAITNVSETQTRKCLRCALCLHTASKSELIDHVQSFHHIEIQKKLLQFNTMQEFELWKMNIEKNTKSSYIKEHGIYHSKDFIRTTFVCHRSGFYKKKGTGERRLKLQGSNKINAFCPASIKLTQKEGTCEIEFVETHLGHENDLHNLFLSKSVRQRIAERLAAKIPMTRILDEVRDSVSSNELERLHLLTRKDLYNIQQQYNLSSTAVRHKSDAIRVQAWANEVKDNECVLLYKPQGEILDPKLNLAEQELQIDLDRGESQESTSTIDTSLISKSNLQSDTILRKEKIKRDILDVLSFLESAKSPAEIDVIEKALCSIKPTLDAINQPILETVPQTKEKVNKRKNNTTKKIFFYPKTEKSPSKDPLSF